MKNLILKKGNGDRKWKVCTQVKDQKIWKQIRDGVQWS